MNGHSTLTSAAGSARTVDVASNTRRMRRRFMSTALTLRRDAIYVNPVDMKRATYHHGDLREALVAAAEKLVADKGVAGFSLREAARDVGVDPAACYRHFRDKQAIIQELAQ